VVRRAGLIEVPPVSGLRPADVASGHSREGCPPRGPDLNWIVSPGIEANGPISTRSGRLAGDGTPDDGARQLRADMATVKAQIDLPTPDHYTIRERLQSARAILEHARGGAATVGLLDLLRTLHL
jgi:hypothetical protein